MVPALREVAIGSLVACIASVRPSKRTIATVRPSTAVSIWRESPIVPPSTARYHPAPPFAYPGLSAFSENWATHVFCSYVDRMTRFLLPLVSIVAFGCSETAIQQSPAVPQAPPVVMIFGGQTTQSGADAANSPGPQREYRQRDVGDFIVYRFSGSLHKSPTMLTKRIIGRTADNLDVDVILEQGRKKERYRLRLSDAPTNRDEVLSAARLEGDRLVLTSVTQFKTLMNAMMVVAEKK